MELKVTDTVQSLKEEIQKKLGSNKPISLFSDEKLTKKINAKDNVSLKAGGFSNGDIVHVGNQDVVMEVAPQKFVGVSMQLNDLPADPKKGEEKVEEKPSSSGMIDTTVKASDGFGKPKVEKKEEPKPYVEEKWEDPAEKSKPKHESFDSFLTEMRFRCAKLHKPDAKCPNCTFSIEQSYKVDYTCKKHRPYPLGMCNRCLPPNVVLSRQVWRHVDYCSFMNFPDLNSFVVRWQQTGCLEQRMAYLYGYYSEDPNFPEGVRVNIEAIYEPPQFGDSSGF